jgi:hypothetical protein
VVRGCFSCGSSILCLPLVEALAVILRCFLLVHRCFACGLSTLSAFLLWFADAFLAVCRCSCCGFSKLLLRFIDIGLHVILKRGTFLLRRGAN